LPVGVAVALITFRFQRRARLATLIAVAIPLAWVGGPLESGSILPLTLFALGAYAVIRLPLPRLPVAFLVTLFTVASLLAALEWWGDTTAVRVIGSFPVLIPILWYSVFEHGGRTLLSLRRFVLYLGARLFSSPVLMYQDLFAPVQGAQLKALRWAGIRTLYIALVASIAAKGAQMLSASAGRESLTTLPLLGLSYVEYVGYYCGFVVRFNTVIGVLRLFGVPLRSNFRYWLLARTPNEHWQRWNILAREWFLTFMFYPVMRARRWLFAAVMAALLGAGFLHTVPLALINGLQAPRAFASGVYWGVNGIAIYLMIKIPMLYPRLPERLGMVNSRTWSIAGIVLTSAFYAILHGLRTSSGTWAEMGSYLSRLLGGISL
jgi:hypothetical protein